MPLRSGYGNVVVAENIRDLRQAGKSLEQAVAAAYSYARACFFRRYPGGALPAWLAYPKGYRTREYYDEHGHPTRGMRFAANPSSARNSREIAQARRLFRSFTGREADRVEKIPLEPLPRTGLAFGELVEVGYISFRDGRPYRHSFRTKSRPLLVATHDGKQVLMLGGAYAFTERGIEDR